MEVVEFGTGLPPAGTRPAPPLLMRPEPGVVPATQEALRLGSDGRCEAAVLWAGRPLEGSAVSISHLILPRFESSARHLVLPQSERILVAEYLRRERLLAFADLHTHPFEAFLSDADRARPFSARDGFFAVVIPDFGAERPGAGWRFYRATSGAWDEVPASEAVDGWSI
jgi:hypothetical protein